MKFAVLMLVAIPPILLLNAWLSMKLKSLPPPRELSEEEARKMLEAGVTYWRLMFAALEKAKGSYPEVDKLDTGTKP